ncbi:zinc knuckle domain containing protein [Nitzschia inconspicua]|uniref:Zinc knuckle domain containing protein n=1 Tax=Nitzschia inconspicua TaxID=303405 RepID=A0A9K3KVN8_9STRA|nr:zinc knuckle domain containing protein [Nitzschia inconspicua]
MEKVCGIELSIEHSAGTETRMEKNTEESKSDNGAWKRPTDHLLAEDTVLTSSSSSPCRKRHKIDIDENVVGEEETMRMEMSSSASGSSADDADPLQSRAASTSGNNAGGSGDIDYVEDNNNIKNNKINNKEVPNNGNPVIDPVLLQHAKKRLSKFAARLFDQNRPKGLVETPQIIPLNDEFLVAFGRREKEFYNAAGRDDQFDQEITSDNEDEQLDDTEGRIQKKDVSTLTEKGTSKQEDSNGESSTKVKINNLSYRTTKETLTNVCLMFGSLKEVKMLMDFVPPGEGEIHNSGRAYVTFDSEAAAVACVDGLKNLEGRDLRVTLATTRAKTAKAPGSTTTTANTSLLNKMFERDISTICFRCGKVGHMEANCQNAAKPKPCTLCGVTDHEQRKCPYNRICFNCGAPGHVNRECTLRRGLPRRMVCGICLQSGHHRLQCHQRFPYQVPPSVLSHAICMACGQNGHFLCKDLKWFYSLRGLSCFNCGSHGHSGYDCQRPTLHHCIQNPEDAKREIERAEENSIAEELERQRQGRGRNSQRDGNGSNGSRSRGSSKVQSMPPIRRGGQQQQHENNQQGFGGGRQDRRGYS